MAVRIPVKLDVDDEKLDKLIKLVGSDTILRLVGLDQLHWIDRNFRNEGIEKKWQPLAASTVYGRRRQTSSILRDTGRLHQSFVAGQPRSKSKNSIEIGSNLEYAGYHHFGTKPYVIRPVQKKALAFPVPGGPVVLRGVQKTHQRGLEGVLSQEVRHPGLPARPILPSEAMAARLAERVIERLFAHVSA